MHYSLFVHSPIKYLGCFQVLPTMNKASVNIRVHGSCVDISSSPVLSLPCLFLPRLDYGHIGPPAGLPSHLGDSLAGM